MLSIDRDLIYLHLLGVNCYIVKKYTTKDNIDKSNISILLI